VSANLTQANSLAGSIRLVNTVERRRPVRASASGHSRDQRSGDAVYEVMDTGNGVETVDIPSPSRMRPAEVYVGYHRGGFAPLSADHCGSLLPDRASTAYR